MALLRLLRDHDGPLSIGELARRMGQSHVAISRVTRELSRAGVIGETGHARDQRVVMLMLLPKGRALLERLQPTHDAIVAAVDGMAGTRGLLRSVRALEEALEELDFAARVRAQKNKRRNRSHAV
jgi:DNA-binding MarR family transcriptional regulator